MVEDALSPVSEDSEDSISKVCCNIQGYLMANH